MATDDWTKKSLKIQQETEKAAASSAAFQAGVEEGLTIAGKGGSPGQPYDDPEKGKGPFVPPPGKRMTIAGNPSFDINETPATRRIRGIRRLQEQGVGGEKGNAGDILKRGVQLPNLQAMTGPDYIGDKLRYGQLDRILNPLGDFRKPTLDQLRIHKNAYPKQASIDLGGGRSLGGPEIRYLREVFPTAPKKEQEKLIKMYGTEWMKADASNNIRRTGDMWRTRETPAGSREFADPITGISLLEWKRMQS